MVWVRYVGTLFEFAYKRTLPIGTVRNLPDLRPSVKIHATVHIQFKVHDIAPVERPEFVPRLNSI